MATKPFYPQTKMLKIIKYQETTREHQYTSIKMAKISVFGKNVKSLEISHIAMYSVKYYSYLGKK